MIISCIEYLLSEQAGPIKDGSTVLVVWEQFESEFYLWLLLTDVALHVNIHLSGHGPKTLQQCLGT